MIAAISCEGALNNIFYIIKNIMNIIMIVAPILAIIAFSVLLIKMTMSPEDKKIIKNLSNSLKALVIIFFIPIFLNIVMYALGENTDISKCYLNSSKVDTNSKYNSSLYKDKEKKSVTYNPRDYEKGDPKQLDFSCKSSILKANFSCETIRIVERHLNDFNYYNMASVINSKGGFKNYTKELGGIFEDYYGKDLKVTKMYEFQRVSEYVFGYMTMYGFDYYNGKQCDSNGHNCSGKWCKWGGSCMNYEDILYNNKLPSSASSDAFFPGQMMYDQYGLSDKKHFDKMISGGDASHMNMTTNCNWAVDMVFFKAGIFGTGRVKTNSSASYSSLYKTAKKVIYKPDDLEVGDILAFFHGTVPEGSSPSSWHNWYHAAYVGETHKDEGYVMIYDGGSYLTNNRSHKWKMKCDGKANKKWVGFRVIELE